MREEGLDHWNGSLFVFDGRMAIRPSECRLPAATQLLQLQQQRRRRRCGHCAASRAAAAAAAAALPGVSPGLIPSSLAIITPALSPAFCPRADKDSEEELQAAAPCQACGATAVLPHMNCANIDCNKLFLACEACKVSGQ